MGRCSYINCKQWQLAFIGDENAKKTRLGLLIPTRYQTKWTSDPDQLPPLNPQHFFLSSVCVSTYTSEQFGNSKSLEAHVRFTNGRVQDLQIVNLANCAYPIVRTEPCEAKPVSSCVCFSTLSQFPSLVQTQTNVR